MSIRNQAENQTEAVKGSFLEENQKLIVGAIGLLLVLVVGFLAYQNLYKAPREVEATNAMYIAEFQFERDSFENALLNPGAGNMGFLDIIDEYSGTETSNLAKYYAGVCYMKLGKFEAAISYLEEYNADGDITPITKNGLIGDAYGELKDFGQAINYYKKACSTGENSYLTPYYLKKLGLLYEKEGQNKEALAAYNRIKSDFASSPDGFNIEKYIDNISSKEL
ncbi:tetratricopeptide repeat protein [Membranihabitans marinus]|uniref:tetratricopeptide repeat protein n=1 Tax=Membranihabitans marinus TaxID=1227546 RepID=UPI001F36E880|nr:tetratricopeptide repeat protein [Membranihabitans marinus]